MNPFKSIKARIDSARNTKKSRYWEYTEFFNDGVVWEDTFFLESFGGNNFQGNPYYIYKELLKEKYARFQIVIAHKNPEALRKELTTRGLIDERVKIVQTGTREYREAVTHAKYLVNNISFPMDFIKKEGQVYLNTWHGTPLKTLGRSVAGDPFACINGQRNYLMSNYLLAPNDLTKRVYEDEYMVQGIMQGELFLGGYPRNSVFFEEEYGKEVKKKYSLDNVKSVFYMPTWRGTACGIEKVDQISEIERLAKELGEGYRVYVKFHPAMQNANTAFQYCLPMPADIEVYEFLNAVDVLITDYSSVFFDFANTGKKIVLYQYDKDEYFKDRGVYKEAEENLPFDIAYTYEELLRFVKDDTKKEYPEFVERFCKYDNAAAAKQAVEKMLGEKPQKEIEPTDLYIIDFPVTEEELFTMREKLEGQKYRFVFVLGKYSGNVQRWTEIEYTSLNVYNRLSPKERRKERRLRALYKCFGNKNALARLRAFGARERRRIWGDLRIGHIYAKDKKLPTAVRYDVENWPTDL
ncbi:MAG: hypothetical protein E7355_03025 [Clostridiales bacterium]|nr:hypothetical protein [Clostridiales bacterium]